MFLRPRAACDVLLLRPAAHSTRSYSRDLVELEASGKVMYGVHRKLRYVFSAIISFTYILAI